MKILLANPAYRKEIGKGYEQYFFCAGSRCPWSLVKPKEELPRYAMFPFMMGYTAAILEENNFQVEAIDAIPLNLSESEFLDQVYLSEPDVILFEPVTTSIQYIAGLAELLAQKLNVIIVFTGSHVTALPEDCLKTYPCIDYILRGEYEFSFLELVKALELGSSINSSIDGIVFRSDGEIIVTPKATIPDLDCLPFPARHLFPSIRNSDLGLYHDGFCQNRPAIQMHSSRGCPFRCDFCLLTQVIYKQGVYRVFSSQRVVDEMKHIRNHHNAGEIYIDDDTFTGSKRHVLDICNLISEQKLNIPWSAMADAMLCDEEMILAMKNAGCIGLKFGLESANQNILQQIKKPLKTDKLSRLVQLCNKLKIKTHVSVSFGHLGETHVSIKETMDYVLSLSSDSIQFSLATPYPGTTFYKQVRQLGLLPETDWSMYDPTHSSIVNLPGIDSAALKAFEAKAHRLWLKRKLFNLSWVLRQVYFLVYIVKKQGIRGFLKRIRRGILLLFSKKFR